MLGETQAEIGAAHEQPSGGVRRAQRERLGQGGGQVEAAESRAGDGFQGRGHGVLGREAGHGVQDGAIAGAAAEIAGQRLMRLAALACMRPGGHHDAGRAEAALRGIGLGQGARDGVIRPQAFDGADGAAMQLAQRAKAGIDGRAAAIGALQHHGAGAAIALGAAFLGAGHPLLAQPVEKGLGGGCAARQCARILVQGEADGVMHAVQHK